MEALIFFKLTERKVDTQSPMIKGILAPVKHILEVIAITSTEQLQMTHQADAVMHLKENGRFEMLKNRNPDIMQHHLLLKVYKIFVDNLRVSVEH